MAKKTATVVARPTKAGYATNSSSIVNKTAFLAGTGVLGHKAMGTSANSSAMVLYGFNFEEIRDKLNNGAVTVTGIKFSCTHKSYDGYYDASKYHTLSTRYATGFSTSSSSYTDLGDGIFWESSNTSDTNYITAEVENSPNTLNWINSNLTSFLNGYTDTTFGVRIYGGYFDISDITMTVTYEYEEGGVKNIYRATTKQTAHKGTSANIKVYKGTTKIYG